MPDADPIDLPRLRRELIRPAGLWQQIDLVSETGSTNADLSARVRAGEPAGSVLITDYQSAGRGRQGRRWTAPPGSGIAMSVSLAPEVDPDRWTWLPLLAASRSPRLEGAMRQRGPSLRLDLKWPNDVLADGLKVCGILAEQIQTPGRPACVVGMGINVHLQADELPVPTATSLGLLVGERVPSRTYRRDRRSPHPARRRALGLAGPERDGVRADISPDARRSAGTSGCNSRPSGRYTAGPPAWTTTVA